MKTSTLLLLTVALAVVPSFSLYIDRDVDEEYFNGNERDSFVNESTITYQLFTNLNPTDPHILRADDLEALQQSNFNPELPTKIFAHGWGGSPRDFYSSRDGYLSREQCNFIAMNWTDMSTGPLPPPADYPYVVEVQVPRAGRNLGELVDFIIENTGAPVSSFHLVGWSLGAHVVGNAGAAITSGKLPRITGLDPAGPFFPLNDTSSRLDISDAEFVDIIHTDSGDLDGNELGMEEPIGHIDFYPNGGADQPGCFHLGNETATRSNCDHARAPRYFSESVTSEIGFRAVLCDSYDSFLAGECDGNPSVLMGDPTPSTARGIYYLATNSKSPYALG